MNDLPNISQKTNLELSEAKEEYIYLKKELESQNWSDGIMSRLEDRMNFIKTFIVEKVIENDRRN